MLWREEGGRRKNKEGEGGVGEGGCVKELIPLSCLPAQTGEASALAGGEDGGRGGRY